MGQRCINAQQLQCIILGFQCINQGYVRQSTGKNEDLPKFRRYYLL